MWMWLWRFVWFPLAVALPEQANRAVVTRLIAGVSLCHATHSEKS